MASNKKKSSSKKSAPKKEETKKVTEEKNDSNVERTVDGGSAETAPVVDEQPAEQPKEQTVVEEPKEQETVAEANSKTAKDKKNKPTKEKKVVKKQVTSTESQIDTMLGDRIATYKEASVVGPRLRERLDSEWADILIITYMSNNSAYYDAVIDFMVKYPNMVSHSNGIVVTKRRLSRKNSDGIRSMVAAFSIIASSRRRKMKPKLNMGLLQASITSKTLFHYLANIAG